MEDLITRIYPDTGPNDPGPAIFLADWLWACEILKPDAGTRSQIAALLGVDKPRNAVTGQIAADGSAIGALGFATYSAATTIEPADLSSRSDALVPTAPQQDEISVIPSSVELTGQQSTRIKIPKADPLPPEIEQPFDPLPFDPLFEPNWTRAILAAGLGTISNDGPVDVDRLVRVIASGEVITEVPHLPAPTLRRGVQLLVDRSRALMPFEIDEAMLQQGILQVVGVGPDKVQIQYFAGDPSQLGGGSRRARKPYESPPPGTVVALLTDLGIGEPPVASERVSTKKWVAFAETVRCAECPLVAFVPYAEARWPPELRPLMTIIPWDRPTTANTVRKRVGIALKVHT